MPTPDLEAVAKRLSGEIRALPMGPARVSPEAEWLNLAWRVVEVAQGRERAQRGSSRAEALRLATQIAHGDRVPVEQLIHVVLRPSEREFRKKLSTERGHATKKTTSAQFDREIAHALKPTVVCGECFMYAYQFVTTKGGTLKHAMVTHPWDKNDFWHAWAEKDGLVHDWQTAEVRKTAPVAIADFYRWWNPRDVQSYTADEARKHLARNKHYGPW